MNRNGPVVCRLELVDERNVLYTDGMHHFEEVPGTVETDPLHTATTYWLADQLRVTPRLVSGQGLKILGRHLYQMLFRGEVHDKFLETFEEVVRDAGPSEAGRSGTRLQLVIVFREKAENLTGLPWEFLYLAMGERGDGTFLTGEKHSLVLTRVVSGHPKIPGPLDHVPTILFVTSTPPGTPSGTTEKLSTLFARQYRDKKIHLVPLEDPTWTVLEKHITEHKPDIVHFVGHGEPGILKVRREPQRIRSDQAEQDVARSAGRQAEPVAQHDDVEVSKTESLFRAQHLRLLFLQTCHSAATVDGEQLYSTATEIVKAGVPAVVAMQYDIEAADADSFAAEFYSQLVAGCTIGEAVYRGRSLLANRDKRAWEDREFGTPVVYIDRDVEVVTVSGPAASTHGDNPAAQPPHHCPNCQTLFKYRACPQCRLPRYCPCKRTKPGCDCETELELPQALFCGNCEHYFELPRPAPAASDGTAVAASPQPAPRIVRPNEDSFGQVS